MIYNTTIFYSLVSSSVNLSLKNLQNSLNLNKKLFKFSLNIIIL